MAIEFRCPYCTAAIRVPDSAAGKTGACPKCSTSVLVPAIEIPPNPSIPVTPQPPAAVQPPAADTVSEAPVVSDPVPAVPVPEAEADSAAVELPDFAAAPTRTSPSLGRQLKQRRKQQQRRRLVTGGIVVVLVSMLIGLVAYLRPSDELTGDLTAAALPGYELPVVTVERAVFSGESADIDFVINELQAEPLLIKSAKYMDVELRGSTAGIELRVFPAGNCRWVRVDTGQHSRLKSFVGLHAATWDKPRYAELKQSAGGFVREWASSEDRRRPVSSLLEYRNQLALNALVRGLGYQVEAVVGKTRYRCIYQDGEDRLYFILPSAVKSFRLSGRPDVESLPRFEGIFQVSVEAAAAAEQQDVETDTSNDPEPESTPSDDGSAD